MKYRPYLLLVIGLLVILLLTNCSPADPGRLPPTEMTQGGGDTEGSSLTAGVQEVEGVVLSGGDQTAEGLLDAPRTFAYEVQLDSGAVITITYTAYPPSPAGENQPQPRLEFQDGVINPGNRISARGTYDPATTTLTVEADTDFIETFSE